MDFVPFNNVKAILISFCKRGYNVSISENGGVSRIFGFKVEEVVVGWNKITVYEKRSFIICSFLKIVSEWDAFEREVCTDI
jgi:hypothetical protein